ncbi:hypothetical protein BLS_000590 [Venturia inaequalis]|uniref:SEC7 domain-containing protein n=1 Tax=Venturia inaequalis TaxID=5025 RepID=A0A8H3Z4F2_VENIN|nr:hypothetical protein BLS_000590 [Venturia inaequalis]KAE9974572.1 hypothetical protein EG328_003745 [Venturia inaequalis]KAE9984984.1 hypothetical protein EG327_004857 [Venturia inaequalis]RDI80595.1 hypothetical protein Vi05172_g9424 [Venturia inaequalis]
MAEMAVFMPPRPKTLTVAVDPIGLVLTECIAVMSAMRKHPRWAHSSVGAILSGGSEATALGTRRGGPQGSEDASLALDAGWKWGSRSKKGKSLQDNPLMSAFTRLRSQLRGCKDIKTFDTPSLLHPFLQVIRSSSTSASITSLALIAMTKFLSYSVISRVSPRLPFALQNLAAAITHCRFEASSTSADEIVYVRILNLMEALISGPTGDMLSDESVCQIMETGLGLCCDQRFTQILQRSAEITMVSMCQVIFERLKHLEFEAGDEPGALDEVTKDDMDNVKMDMEPTTNGDSTLAPEIATNGEEHTSTSAGAAETVEDSEKSQELEPLLAAPQVEDPNSSTVDLGVQSDDEEALIKPYSLPSIKELFRSLVELLDPHDRAYTDTMRVMALRIVDVALEVAGPSIASHPSLASLAKDTLCRHLFQLVRSENMAILNESLRVAGTLLATCRNVLKLQQELYLSYLVACLFPRVMIPHEPGVDPKLYEGIPQAPGVIKPAPPQQPGSGSGRNTPVPVRDRQRLGLEGGSRKPDAREAMIESIGALVRMPTFMAELFVNYDCQVDRHDLCADMVGLLSRNAFPDSATWSTTNVPPLCLDAILGFVQTVADRLDDEPITEGFPSAEQLRNQRDLKATIIRGTAKFNESPKAGIAFLASHGVISSVDDPKAIAQFIQGSSRLDKKVLGDFISKGSNEKILVAFLEAFDFQGKTVEESLREVLYTFRLPGESQLIERIVVEFAKKYIKDGNHDNIANEDAIFVLTYAIIMLNTDQFNPNVKDAQRMKLDNFARNLRGVNDGKDFDMEYLESIFLSIKSKEIVLPEEHSNKDAFGHAWKELLVKVDTASDLVICDTNIYDADMFAATWKPIVATLSYVFMSASEDAVFSRVFTGFAQCAQIAARHGSSDALDKIVFSLSSISTLATGTLPSTSLNTEVQANEKSVMVSETAVRFGRDDRAQQATVVLFRVLEGNEATLRDGWEYVFRIMLNLFINSLIPASFNSKHLDLPAIPLQPPAQVVDRGERHAEGGLFSGLSSYLSSFANDEPPEPSEQEIENTLAAVDCIGQCDFEELMGRITALPVESLRSVIDTLLSQIPEDSSPSVITVKPDLPPTSPRTSGTRRKANTPTYDPTMVYVLELATILTLKDEESVRELGKDVAGVLEAVIRNASNVHYVAISRVVYYILTLLRSSDDYGFLRAPVVLHTFATFDQELLEQCALPLISGMADCIQGSSSGLRSEMATSPDFWDILRKLHGVQEVSPYVFRILAELQKSPATQPAITADNYEQAIVLLNDFATAGAQGAKDEQRRDIARRRKDTVGKVPKPKHKQEVERAVKAMGMVYDMTSRVPSFIAQSHLETTEAWTAYWSPIFRVLTQQCLNPCREIRTQAFSCLRQTLLNPVLLTKEEGDRDKEWTAIFDEILFPLINQLLKPEIYTSDPGGMGETRVEAATLLCRIFLHFLVQLAEWGGMVALWVKILGVMDRLMASGQGESLEEAVAENMKNILLVMQSGGYLAPPEEKPEQAELWNETWKKLNRFLPHLYKELYPDVKEVDRGGEAKKAEVVAPVGEK